MRYFLFLILFVPISALATGKLLLIGGGEEPRKIIDEMISLSDGKILIMPHASSVPLEVAEETKIQLERAGASGVETCVEAPDKCLGKIRETNLVFFTGGSQGRLLAAFNGTSALQLIFQRYEHNLSVAGTSAGTVIMSEVMLTGDPDDPYDRGFALLNKMILDMHFLTRNRQERLLKALSDHPGFIGIGIDEGTAILVENGRFTVIGDSSVFVYLNSTEIALTNGERFSIPSDLLRQY
jgi:cyanophycinase